MSDSENLKSLIQELNAIGAIKFGSFKLKSGILSPIYIDLRVTISYPRILKKVSQLMWEKVSNQDVPQFELICGVPYTALPFATCLSLDHDIPLLMRRKEGPKDYGTKKAIEGVFRRGQECLLIEDLVTSGGSVLEVVHSLQEEGLVVKDVVVFLDREQGGKDAVEARGVRLHSVLRFSQMLQILEDEKMLDSATIDSIKKFLEKNQVGAQEEVLSKPKGMSFARRAELANPIGAELFRLMESKKSNLCVAVDVTTKAELLSIADKVGEDICLLKTHVDIIEDFDADLVVQLQALAKKHNFMIFEDRKFADIGNTTKLQYQKGIYHIADWAHLVNAHIVPGPGIIQGLKEAGMPKGRGLILLAEMSSEGTMANGSYTETAVKMAEANKDFVIGFISVKAVSNDPSFIHITPGVQLQTGGDSLGQTYKTPEDAIGGGSDIVVVGRGIYQATNVKEEATKYRLAAWSAYERRI